MAFPDTLDEFANPTATDTLAAANHNGLHTEERNAIDALESKVGITSSADMNSVDYSRTTGWVGANETWTYSSTDDPTGVISISGNKTTKYSAGMRIRFVNGGNTIYGIITAVSYSAPNTLVTFLHEIDSSDNLALYLMANSAITSPCYSSKKIPYGFPADPTHWEILKTDSVVRTQSTPTNNTWYNAGSTNAQITIPIGLWEVSYDVHVDYTFASGSGTYIYGIITLSTTNNSQSDSDLTSMSYDNFASTSVKEIVRQFVKAKTLSLAAKTLYYLNGLIDTNGSTPGIAFYNTDSHGIFKMKIKARCAYL